MTGRERLKNAFQCQKTDRIPWVPFVGCHAGALIATPADEFLKSSDLIVKGMNRAIEQYRPDGIPVTFDLQIEAECFGCDLNWAKENPPAVVTHPLGNGTVLGDLQVPGPDQGRIPTVLDACRRIRKEHEDIALYGLITGPFTLGLHLLGTDIFMKMFDDMDMIHRLMAFCGKVCRTMSDYYIDAGCDIIAVVDPMTSQIGPDQFRQFVTEQATETFAHIREHGSLGSFFVCGHAQQNIEAMCETQPDNVSVDENIPLEFVRDTALENGISFGGNMQLTTVLLLGDPVDSQKNAIACMEIGGEKGFILAPGCDLPYATPPENLQAVIEVVEDDYKRKAVKTMVRSDTAGEMLNLGEYGQSGKVIVDIITLDSEACAPCQYMVDSVKKVAPEFEGLVEWREHKIKYRESIVFMTSLMVRNIPTICIDGKITFVSQIPPRDKLIAAIQQRINEKFSRMLKSKRATFYLLCKEDDEKGKSLLDNIETARREMGSDIDVRTVTDASEFTDFGITSEQTPAVIEGRYELRSSRVVPETAAIKEWIKNVTR